MQENFTVARPYATAAFELAHEHNDLGAWSDMLKLISIVISDPRMPLVLENPKLDSAFQTAFITDICGDQLSAVGKNFVKVLADARRLSQAPAIYKLFEQLRLEQEQIEEVEVISAYPLDDQERQRIVHTMEQRFGRKVNISTRIDKSLIGGTVIRAGDSVIDASVKGSLRQLGNQLVE
jgi:F-type H+-transporting ATPase subunit delta